MRAARKSEYASTTHCTSVVVAFRSTCSTGSATLATEPSIKAMLDPRIVAISTQRSRFGEQGAASGAARITPSSQGAFTKFAISFSLSGLCSLSMMEVVFHQEKRGTELAD